ncbi:hypothetical protein F383_17929 [Gossypium arboreum]|uniref:Uncharacterized protein n=1 Tax=Gossypium arboreum TaxID=29729 RepID=A0A0B0NWA5_GOSAR|nr:hypothetical protein F383_17929 [Gossypium arboreum]
MINMNHITCHIQNESNITISQHIWLNQYDI